MAGDVCETELGSQAGSLGPSRVREEREENRKVALRALGDVV